MFDFMRIRIFCLEKRLSKNKMTVFSKNLEGPWPLCPPLATPMKNSDTSMANIAVIWCHGVDLFKFEG